MTVDSTTKQAVARPQLLNEVRVSFQSESTRSKPSFIHAPSRLILCLLLALATIATYIPITHAPFLNYDDAQHVTENPHVRAGLTWRTIVWSFRTSEALDWHPITWLSHALDCELFGVNPEAHHTVNILIHAANVVILFLILQSATGFLWRSLFVALLLALHPINVESVAWISERKDVLSMFFMLIALAAYGWYARRPSIGRYLAIFVAYALGLMTKAQVITFPFALLLLDYWPLYRFGQNQRKQSDSDVSTVSFPALVLEKLPLFALSAASAIITMKVEAPATQATLPFKFHLANAAFAYVKYLGKAFWPANLALVYPHPQLGINFFLASLAAFTLIAISALVFAYQRRRYLFVGWFWFLGILVPMIGLVQISVSQMADRYAYIPLLGIFVIVCWGAADFAQAYRLPRQVLAVIASITLLAIAFAQHRQEMFWIDNATLWRHTLAITGTNYTAEDNLGTALLAEDKIDEAIPHFQRALFLRPDDSLAMLNLASYEGIRGNYPAAIAGYTRLLQITHVPSYIASANLNLGFTHFTLKQYNKAKQDFAASLAVQPENPVAYRSLGLIAQKGGDLRTAIQDYQRSVELEPSSIGYLLWAQSLERAGNHTAAQAAEAQAANMTQNPNRDLATVRQLLSD
jgi:protein O-mannosyl-transferase